MYKDISIFIKSENTLNLLQIFDVNDSKIEEVYINNNYVFKGKLNDVYRIKIMSYTNTFISSFLINENYTGPYIFDIRKPEMFHKIFIKVTDQNYNGLKILKGEIKLWQNHIV